MYFVGLSKHYHFSLDTPIKDLPKEAVDVILYGTKGEKIKMYRQNEYGSGTYNTDFEGIINNLERRYKETNSEFMRDEIAQCMSHINCPCLLYTSYCYG